jgi:hypothetical protein
LSLNLGVSSATLAPDAQPAEDQRPARNPTKPDVTTKYETHRLSTSSAPNFRGVAHPVSRRRERASPDHPVFNDSAYLRALWQDLPIGPSAMFKVDASEVFALEREADRVLDRTLPIMRGAVALNLEIERQGHPYRNRTGNLERSTISYDAADPRDREIKVVAEMGMSYASHVNERGYSLIDGVMKNAGEEIQNRLEQEAEKLERR